MRINLSNILKFTISLFILLSFWTINVSTSTAEGEISPTVIAGRGERVTLVADPTEPIYHLPAADDPTGSREESNAFNIMYLENTSNSAGDWCETWSSQAKVAFTAAASIWASSIDTSVPIVIEACWTNLGSNSGILGYSLQPDHIANFPGAPMSNTGYPVSLANALAGFDQNGSEPEMYLAFNLAFPFYLGTDGNTPEDQYDLETVVLHEIGHGLGFAGSAYQSAGFIYWGSPPFSYDRFTQNGSGTPMLSFPSGIQLTQQMTSDNVFFNGPNAKAANGGNPVKLYAPSTWKPGSSYSHLDNIYNSTPNALMTYALGDGVSIHDPGPITKGLLNDIGWKNSPPTISGIPDFTVAMNSTNNGIIDLRNYAHDFETPDDGLTFAIKNSPASGAGVSLDGSKRYVNINPSPGWSGQTDVTIEVSDPGGETDSDTFQVTVAKMWNGSGGTNWFTPGNWTPAEMPSASELVVIPPKSNQPIISGNDAVVGRLIIQPGAVLDLSDKTLFVEDQINNNGTLKQSLLASATGKTSFITLTTQNGLLTKYYGVDITLAPFSSPTNVTVSIHGNQFCSPQVPGVKRCYQITPGDSISATVRFYFTTDEQDGHTLMNLSAFHYKNGKWLKEPGVHSYPIIGEVKYVNVEGIDEFSPFALSEMLINNVTFLPVIQRGR